jgi:hypothetical protein
MELLVNGTCQGDGCNDNTNLFVQDTDGHGISADGRRKLAIQPKLGDTVEGIILKQQNQSQQQRQLQSQCYCSAQSYDRGVTELEFMVSHQQAYKAVQNKKTKKSNSPFHTCFFSPIL